MKKTVKMIGMACLVGAFAFAGSSCKKNNNDTTSIKVNMPGVEVSSVDGDRAYIDYGDGNKMKWSKDDQIMFYNLNENDYRRSVRNVYTLYQGANDTLGYFNGGLMGDLMGYGGYFAFYPASKVETHEIGPRNSQTFDVPDTQNYNVNRMDPTSLVMATKGENIIDNGFNLNHIFGFVNLKLKGTQKVEWISITDNELNLSGNITIDLPAVNATTLQGLVNICADYTATWDSYMATLNGYLHGDGGLNYNSDPSSDKTITLVCEDPVQLTNEYTNFYITLRPGCLGKGFVVKVKYEGEAEPVVYNKFNPTVTGEGGWAYGAYAQYPRAFCIKPGNAMNCKVN